MPSSKQKEAPDRSRPETTGRELSLDERKDDLARLRDIAQALTKLCRRLDGLHNSVAREALIRFMDQTTEQLEGAAEDNVIQIQRIIFERTEERAARVEPNYKGGTRKV